MNAIPQPSGADFSFTLSRQQVGFVYTGLIQLVSELSRYELNPDNPPHALLSLLCLRDINPEQHQHNTASIMRLSQMMLDALQLSGRPGCSPDNLGAALHHYEQAALS